MRSLPTRHLGSFVVSELCLFVVLCHSDCTLSFNVFRVCSGTCGTTPEVPPRSSAGEGCRIPCLETRAILFSIGIFAFQAILRYGCGGVDCGSIALHVTNLESSRTASGVPAVCVAVAWCRCTGPETRGRPISIGIFAFQAILRYGCGGVDCGSIALHVTNL